MLTPGTMSAVLAAAGTLALCSPASAQGSQDQDVPLATGNDLTAPPSEIELSANVALVSDYRFRGVSFSGGDPAIQGGFDLAHQGGFYAGAWASSMDGSEAMGEMELDLYAGYSTSVGNGLTIDAGLLYYVYPTGDGSADTDYFEPYASISFLIGPAEAKAGVAYAWEQDSLGGRDNLYLYTDASVGIPTTPVSVSAHLGYTDGSLAPAIIAGGTDDTGFDYSVGASVVVLGGMELGLTYVGVDGPTIDGLTDDTLVASVGFSF